MKIDYILVDDDAGQNIKRADVERMQKGWSDHDPIWVELDLDRNRAEREREKEQEENRLYKKVEAETKNREQLEIAELDAIRQEAAQQITSVLQADKIALNYQEMSHQGSDNKLNDRGLAALVKEQSQAQDKQVQNNVAKQRQLDAFAAMERANN